MLCKSEPTKSEKAKGAALAVAGLAAEELGEVAPVGRDKVHGEMGRRERDTVGVVGLRDAHEQARRVDAALGCEADEAARGLPLRRGGHDVDRVVESFDEGGEVLLAEVLGCDAESLRRK
mgnify:CR=1 FL=1